LPAGVEHLLRNVKDATISTSLTSLLLSSLYVPAGVEHLLRNVKDATISTSLTSLLLSSLYVACRRGAPAAQREGCHNQHAGE
jgi:hypothetical protein